MENICKNCVHCTGGNHDSNPVGIEEQFTTKDSVGVEMNWFPISGSRCGITDCYHMDVQECDRFEKKHEENKTE